MNTQDRRKKILFLSVGGSSQPLRSSLREGCPDHVVFVVSDGSDGSPSSGGRVDELLSAEGCPESHESIEIPPDDIDGALATLEPFLSKAQTSDACVTVDYTGGTKSMTSAMVLAATSHAGVRLQFMAGTRIDLTQIADGTEKPVVIPTELIGMSQSFRMVQGFVRRRNYGAAHAVLGEIGGSFARLKGKVPPEWKRKVAEERKWVEIFDHWDRFDHTGSLEKLTRGLDDRDPHATWFEGEGSELCARLKSLVRSGGAPSYDLLEDLWLNAQRRARLGQYDDAVARLYRLMEAAVQARLWNEHGINSSKVPLARLPEALRKKHCHQGQTKPAKLALSDSICMLLHVDPHDPLPRTMENGHPDWQLKRNNSILAHGFTPLTAGDWTGARRWFEKRSDVLWKDRLGRSPLGQLPDEIPVF